MRPALAIALVVAGLGVAACASSPMTPGSRGEGGDNTPSFSQFSDVPVPAKASMDVDHSLLLGHGDSWVGRLVFSSWWSNTGALYDFYRAEMPGYGWREITSMRGPTSVQTWQRSERVATIQISDTTFGVEVVLTMAPAVGAGMPTASAPAPVPKVSRQKLQ